MDNCSLDIAKELKITHKSVRNMILKYKSDFMKYGDVIIKTEKPGKGTKGGKPRKVIYLNKNQKSLLFMYLGNTKINRQNKILFNDLIKEVIN